VDICINGISSTTMVNPLVTISLVLPAFVLVPVVTIVLDVTLVRSLKKKNSINAKSFQIIPIRATVVSTLTLFLPLLMGIITRLMGITDLSVAMTQVVVLLFVVIRCPVVTLVSFAYSDKMESEEKTETREMRLKKVLFHAEEEMKMRKTLPLSQERQFCVSNV
jgi:hypothetical protein